MHLDAEFDGESDSDLENGVNPWFDQFAGGQSRNWAPPGPKQAPGTLRVKAHGSFSQINSEQII